MRFRADPPDGVRMVPLDILTAVYHRRSAQTHLVTEPVPEILEVLVAGDADVGELLARLDVADSIDSRAALAARLDEMIASGLVSVI